MKGTQRNVLAVGVTGGQQKSGAGLVEPLRRLRSAVFQELQGQARRKTKRGDHLALDREVLESGELRAQSEIDTPTFGNRSALGTVQSSASGGSCRCYRWK